MKRFILCLVGLILMSATLLRAQDSSALKPKDTASLTPADTTGRIIYDTTAAQQKHDTAAAQTNASQTTNPATTPSAMLPGDSATRETAPTHRSLDNRWFISPLLKLQFQDFAIIEKNRLGKLSNANMLPFFNRGNASFAASAYKNITNRLSFSADLGLSFGHATTDSIMIGQTSSKTYNLINASFYYHLLSPNYRFQPFVYAGVNDIVSDASYLCIPMGVGVKFNSRKIMVLAEGGYGYAVTKNFANTTVYSLGIYLPVNNKKKKPQIDPDVAPYNRNAKKDTAQHATVVNNFYITIKMDSTNKSAQDSTGGSGSGKHRRKGDGSASDDQSASDQPFDLQDEKVDTVDGKPVYHFFVYFEFNEYTLNSKAFATVDHAIAQLRGTPHTKILINGYTDDVGTVPQNNFISRKRSQMVYDYMNSRGIASERMVPKFFGKENPVASNESPNTAWLNRRVEIIVKDKDNENDGGEVPQANP